MSVLAVVARVGPGIVGILASFLEPERKPTTATTDDAEAVEGKPPAAR